MVTRPSLGFVALLVGSAAAGCGTSPGNGTAPADAGVADLGSTTDTGSAPVDRPAADTGAMPTTCGAALGACNVVTNTGCTTGNGCYAVRAADGGVAAQCAPAGPHGWGDSCASANDCREGFACLGSPGACLKLCCGNDNASCRDEAHGGRAGSLCVGGITGTDVRSCMEVNNCDVYATSNNGCPAGRPRCEFIAADGTTNCYAAQAGVAVSPMGGPCCTDNRCEPGFVCVPADLTMAMAACNEATPNRVCRRACQMGAGGGDAGAQCPAGQSCSLGFNGAPMSYGACVPSM